MRRWAMVVVGVVVLGCHDSAAPQSVLGSYTLESVGGQELPVVMSSTPDYSFAIIAGTVDLHAQGDFREIFTYEVNDAGVIATLVRPCFGNWTKTGNSLSLQEESPGSCGALNAAVWDGGNTLTVTSPRFAGAAAYRR